MQAPAESEEATSTMAPRARPATRSGGAARAASTNRAPLAAAAAPAPGDDRRWVFVDGTDGAEQGPLTTEQMKNWYASKGCMLPQPWMVKRVGDAGDFVAMSAVPELCTTSASAGVPVLLACVTVAARQAKAEAAHAARRRQRPPLQLGGGVVQRRVKSIEGVPATGQHEDPEEPVLATGPALSSSRSCADKEESAPTRHAGRASEFFLHDRAQVCGPT